MKEKMKQVCVADVGDGLCLGLNYLNRDCMLVDCGSNNGARYALKGYQWLINTINRPNSFVLSHVHKDHYNGLLEILKRKKMNPTVIDRVYYPKIPDFRRKNEFLRDIFCMNLFLLGEDTGIMEYDLLKIITKLNRDVSPYNVPLWKGKFINEGTYRFEILWPPQELVDEDVLKIIDDAISAFNAALDAEPDLKELLGRIVEEGVYRKYGEEESYRYNGEKGERWILKNKGKKRKLSEEIKKANKLLKKAANHLSLSFMLEDQFLFLGDLEEKEIKIVISELLHRLNRDFEIVITPHHGTHHHDNLNLINCNYAISSIGKGLFRHLKPIYKEISRNHMTTWIQGNISLLFYPKSLTYGTYPWYKY